MLVVLIVVGCPEQASGKSAFDDNRWQERPERPARNRWLRNGRPGGQNYVFWCSEPLQWVRKRKMQSKQQDAMKLVNRALYLRPPDKGVRALKTAAGNPWRIGNNRKRTLLHRKRRRLVAGVGCLDGFSETLQSRIHRAIEVRIVVSKNSQIF